MLDLLEGMWSWLLSLWPDSAWSVWLFEKPKVEDDLSLLCCIFTLNVGLSLVDDLRNALARRLREIASGGSTKSRTEKWMRKLGKLDGRRYRSQKRHLQDVVEAAMSYNEKIPNLFVSTGDFFKWLMVLTGGVALWCMAVPNTCRITIILAAPFFLYLFCCVCEFSVFYFRRRSEFKYVDAEFKKVEEQLGTIDDGEALKGLLQKLNDNIAELNRSFPGILEGLGVADHEKNDNSDNKKSGDRAKR